jgi:hypothetical protein
MTGNTSLQRDDVSHEREVDLQQRRRERLGIGDVCTGARVQAAQVCGEAALEVVRERRRSGRHGFLVCVGEQPAKRAAAEHRALERREPGVESRALGVTRADRPAERGKVAHDARAERGDGGAERVTPVAEMAIERSGRDAGATRDHRHRHARGVAALQQACRRRDDLIARDARARRTRRRDHVVAVEPAEVLPVRSRAAG